jgi:hypothetical protein
MQYTPLEEALSSMGACTLTKFGFTNGLLPVGYMPTVNNWHSQLTFYEDKNYQNVPISTDGASMTETQCRQAMGAVSKISFLVK